MNLGLDQLVTHPGSVNPPSATTGPRLRVLQVGKFYPPHMGGIETHLQALCGALKAEVDLRVIVSNDDRRSLDHTLDGVAIHRVATLLTAFSTPISPAMVARIRASRADVVHIHLPNPTAVLAYLASSHRGRLVITY